ncbi:VOC family protein [Amycolatopsis rhabdoformis]|uniref:VOC family protein n=1 Tax=Amycolatopsis rhabdoformis TaxID=1448059 RepID=A0ABZ1IKT4_9PSEU|nr:VOC family protein [Amycolatopsis rhabdoformis]WSE34105.1 VOC family protein [Amycolatopsis rhabdoformis]
MTTEDVRRVDMKVEVLVLPVADVERAKEFYGRLGWRPDETPPGVVQFTPHGSACSVQFGAALTDAEPGSAKGYLVVADLVAARDALVAAGVEVGEIFHVGRGGREAGLDPDRGTYRSRATFADPDGNQWLLQEVTSRLPGRVDPAEATFSSAGDLAAALRRAEAAHGEHEKRTGERDENWPDWYAAYIVAERTGTELPT